jgi:hypothetical protein
MDSFPARPAVGNSPNLKTGIYHTIYMLYSCSLYIAYFSNNDYFIFKFNKMVTAKVSPCVDINFVTCLFNALQLIQSQERPSLRALAMTPGTPAMLICSRHIV